MKRLFLLLLVLSLTLISCTDLPTEEKTDNEKDTVYSDMYFILDGEKWKLCGSDGLAVTEPIFEEVGDNFCFSLCPVKQNGKWGYITETGEFIIEPRYETAYGFDKNGCALIFENGRYGIIDTDGNYILEPVYDSIGPIKYGRCIAGSDGKYTILNEKYEAVSEPIEYYMDFFYETGYATLYADKGMKGCINADGEIIAEPIYNELGRFAKNGLANFKLGSRRGYINTKGEIVLELEGCIDAAEFHDNGLARAVFEDGIYFINEKGEKVLGPYNNDTLINPYYFTKSGLCKVSSNETGLVGLMDENGEMLTDFEYDIISEASFPVEYPELFWITLDEKYGLMKDGKVILEPQFQFIDGFEENGTAPYAVIEEDGDQKWGLINLDGEILTEPIFDSILRFGEKDFTVAALDGKDVFINKNGNILSPEYDNIRRLGKNSFVFSNDGEWGACDYEYNTIIESAAEIVIAKNVPAENTYGAYTEN